MSLSFGGESLPFFRLILKPLAKIFEMAEIISIFYQLHVYYYILIKTFNLKLLFKY